MRTYRINSPQAAARIVGLAMLADGHMCKAELDVLDRLGVHHQLGLHAEELHVVVHALCEDLLGAAVEHWGLQRRMLQPELASRSVEHV